MIDVIIRITKHSKSAYFNKDVSKETKERVDVEGASDQ